MVTELCDLFTTNGPMHHVITGQSVPLTAAVRALIKVKLLSFSLNFATLYALLKW